MNSKRVLAAGVFDGLHAGHRYFLDEARSYGDTLAVIVTSDPVARAEGKQPQFSARERARLVTGLALANRVVVGRSDGDIVKTVLRERPDVIALGYDQRFSKQSLRRLLATIGWRGTIVRVTKMPHAR